MKGSFLSKQQATTLALTLLAGGLSNTAIAVPAVGGNARNSNVIITASGANNWTVLTSINFANPNQRFCTATGSADALLPNRNNGRYRYLFTVSNSPNPPTDQGQERTLEFWNQGQVLDNLVKEITTTGGWMANAGASPTGYFDMSAAPTVFGSRNIYFLAKKTSALMPNLTVTDASMTVTCADNELSPPPPLIIIDPLPVIK